MIVRTDGTLKGTTITLPDGSEMCGVKWVQIFVSDSDLDEITVCYKANAILEDVSIFKVKDE